MLFLNKNDFLKSISFEVYNVFTQVLVLSIYLDVVSIRTDKRVKLLDDELYVKIISKLKYPSDQMALSFLRTHHGTMKRSSI